MKTNEDILNGIKKFGGGKYKPFNYAVFYPLYTQEFCRTGFMEIAPSLRARDYKDPLNVLIKCEKQK